MRLSNGKSIGFEPSKVVFLLSRSKSAAGKAVSQAVCKRLAPMVAVQLELEAMAEKFASDGSKPVVL